MDSPATPQYTAYDQRSTKREDRAPKVDPEIAALRKELAEEKKFQQNTTGRNGIQVSGNTIGMNNPGEGGGEGPSGKFKLLKGAVYLHPFTMELHRVNLWTDGEDTII